MGSRVHNLTREYFVGMPRQADVHLLKRELNKTKEMLEDMREESADFSDLKELRGDLLSRVHNITREYLLTQPHQSDIHSLRRDLNATRLMVGELGTDLDERPTHADLAKMKLAVWNTTRDFLEKDYLSVNKALLSMSAQQVSGPKFTGLKQPGELGTRDLLRAHREQRFVDRKIILLEEVPGGVPHGQLHLSQIGVGRPLV